MSAREKRQRDKTGLRLHPAEAARLRARRRRERLLHYAGLATVAAGLGLLAAMLLSVAFAGAGALTRTELKITAPPMAMTGEVTPASIRNELRAVLDNVPGGRKGRRALNGLLGARAAEEVEAGIESGAAAQGWIWITASDEADYFYKSGVPGRLSEMQTGWIAALDGQARLRRSFNGRFFLSADSREPEYAGIAAALIGSFLSLLVCFAVSFPIGVLAAIYLEKFAPKNRLTHFIEININNLAAVRSIIFGLLGLAILLNFIGLPRGAALVGGLVLAMMSLPTIIIAARAALAAIPSSTEQAALALGASKVQSVFHHSLPGALPGILTGAIIAMAQALGETAPLLMIGMVAFISQIPQNFTDAASLLPVQIYLWANSPEPAFAARAAAAILVLLLFLVLRNAAAIFLRHRFEQK